MSEANPLQGAPVTKLGEKAATSPSRLTGSRPHVVVGDRDDVALLFSLWFRHRVEERLSTGDGVFTVAIPGGRTATWLLPHLVRLPAVAWQRIHFFFVDERAVPEDDDQSNVGLAMRLLFEPLGLSMANVHPAYTPGMPLDECANRYRARIEGVCGGTATLDLVLLGVGPDGHVASLFAADAAEAEAEVVIPIRDSPKPPSDRLSLSYQTLAFARCVVLATHGKEKAWAIASALNGTVLPVTRVIRAAQDAWLFLDGEAASGT